MNDVGNRIVENYMKAEVKSPGGLCFGIAAERVEQAYRDVTGQNLTDFFHPDMDRDVFENIWKSHCYMTAWKDRPDLYPKELKAKGAPAAMAYAGEAEMFNQKDTWKGKLQPGAVIQIWNYDEDYKRVRDFDTSKWEDLKSYGHSFIFLNYEYDDRGKIKGMLIADQSDRWMKEETEVFLEKYFEFWVGANLTRSYPEGSICDEPDAVAALLSANNTIDESNAVNYNIHYCKKMHALNAGKIVETIKHEAQEFANAAIKNAIAALYTQHFNLYFAQLVAIYQMGAGLTVDGKFGDYTCTRLVGHKREEAESLKDSPETP